MNAKVKILLVEDSPGDMLLARKAIAKTAMKVVLSIAQTGEQALRLALEQKPDLILLDLNLPDILGFDVLAQMRSEPHTADATIFVLSTSRNPKDSKRAFELGVAGYQSKPRTYQEYAAFVDHVTAFVGHNSTARITSP